MIVFKRPWSWRVCVEQTAFPSLTLWPIGSLAWGPGRSWTLLTFGACCVETGTKRMKSPIWWLMGLKVMVGASRRMGREPGGCDIERRRRLS